MLEKQIREKEREKARGGGSSLAWFRVQNKGSPQIRLTILLVSEEGERKGGGGGGVIF